VHGALAPADLVAWMLEDRLDARLNLQVHKVVWGDRRGV
jgi:7-carboxy-7-deazaguanine synthase